MHDRQPAEPAALFRREPQMPHLLPVPGGVEFKKARVGQNGFGGDAATR